MTFCCFYYNKLAQLCLSYLNGVDSTHVIRSFLLLNFKGMIPCWKKTKLKRYPIEADSTKERCGIECGAHDESKIVVCAITSLIKWRHSEKCFSVAAAIYFLVLIYALWQGFVQWNNEQLYHTPSPLIVVARQKEKRMIQVCISLIRKRGFKMAGARICGSKSVQIGARQPIGNLKKQFDVILKILWQSSCYF